jgi:hypothetical protein
VLQVAPPLGGRARAWCFHEVAELRVGDGRGVLEAVAGGDREREDFVHPQALPLDERDANGGRDAEQEDDRLRVPVQPPRPQRPAAPREPSAGVARGALARRRPRLAVSGASVRLRHHAAATGGAFRSDSISQHTISRS